MPVNDSLMTGRISACGRGRSLTHSRHSPKGMTSPGVPVSGWKRRIHSASTRTRRHVAAMFMRNAESARIVDTSKGVRSMTVTLNARPTGWGGMRTRTTLARSKLDSGLEAQSMDV